MDQPTVTDVQNLKVQLEQIVSLMDALPDYVSSAYLSHAIDSLDVTLKRLSEEAARLR